MMDPWASRIYNLYAAMPLGMAALQEHTAYFSPAQAIAVLCLIVALGMIALKREVSRVLEAVERVPDERWFKQHDEIHKEMERCCEDHHTRIAVVEDRCSRFVTKAHGS